ncbi:MAG: hypothetical protein ACI9R3_004027 [Verrucomicrobiales bacterium]|jgi:hypothetical protein
MHLLARLAENDQFFQFVISNAQEVVPTVGNEVHVLRLEALIGMK